MSPFEIDILADAVADRVAAKLAGGAAGRALDVYGVAELLDCSVPTVERLVAAGELPSYRVGRLRRFDRADVLAALKSKGGCNE